MSFFPSLFSLMPAQCHSQQTTQQASFLENQSPSNPVDVEVPKDVFGAIIDAQPSPISNTGSLDLSNSDSDTCPPLAAGDGLAGAGSLAGPNASFEFLAREMATQFARQNDEFSVLQSSMADMHRQLRELSITIALTTEWMRSFETRH